MLRAALDKEQSWFTASDLEVYQADEITLPHKND